MFCFADLTLAVHNVEQIWHKETRIRGQQRAAEEQRLTGKPARRDRPTYDNNPLVAWEFLKRLQAENGGDGLVFQRQGEEYSPWQSAQVPPQTQVPAERPATFAEAVRHKLNATNGISGPPGATKGMVFPTPQCLQLT